MSNLLHRLRRSVPPLGWLAIVLAGASILTLALLPLAARVLGTQSAWDPLLGRAEALLEDQAVRDAGELVERAREELPHGQTSVRHGPGAEVRIVLVQEGSPSEVARELGRFLAAEGIPVTSLSMSRQLAHVVRLAAKEPSFLLEGAAEALPVALFTGGILLLLAGSVLRRRLPRADVAPRGTRAGRVAAGAGIGAGCVVLVGLASLILAELGAPIREQPWVARVLDAGGPLLAVVAFYVVVVGPLGEEVFFRGYLFPALSAVWGPTGGALLSSVAFAAVHGHAPALPIYLLYALVLGWAAERWRSLAVPFTAHVVVNATALLSAWLGR